MFRERLADARRRGAIAVGRCLVSRAGRHRRLDSPQPHSPLAPARTRRPAARKAIDHDRLGHSLRVALAQSPALWIAARDRHARARHRLDRRGVLARQRLVPAAVPVPGAGASRLRQRDRAEVEPRDDRRQLSRLRAVAPRSESVRGDRALRRARLQSRHRRRRRSHGRRLGDDGFHEGARTAADHRPHVHAGRGFAEGPAGHADRRSRVARAIRRARRRARQGAQAQ